MSELKGKVAIGMEVAGGAAVVTGVVLAIINHPKRILPDMEVTATHGGASATLGWRF